MPDTVPAAAPDKVADIGHLVEEPHRLADTGQPADPDMGADTDRVPPAAYLAQADYSEQGDCLARVGSEFEEEQSNHQIEDSDSSLATRPAAATIRCW